MKNTKTSQMLILSSYLPMKLRVFPIIAPPPPQLSGQITFNPTNHGR